MLSPVPSDQSIGRKWQWWGVGITLGEGYWFNQVLNGESLPWGATSYTFIFHFFAERYAFHVPFIDKTIRLLVMTSEIFELKTIFNFLRKYHQTSLLWKPTGQREVSAECLPITDVFTMISVGPTRGVFVLRRCPEYKWGLGTMNFQLTQLLSCTCI